MIIRVHIEERPKFFGFTFEVTRYFGAIWFHFNEKCIAVYWNFRKEYHF